MYYKTWTGVIKVKTYRADAIHANCHSLAGKLKRLSRMEDKFVCKNSLHWKVKTIEVKGKYTNSPTSLTGAKETKVTKTVKKSE